VRESPREEEMTVDKVGEREMSELREPSEAPALPHNQATQVRARCQEQDGPTFQKKRHNHISQSEDIAM